MRITIRRPLAILVLTGMFLASARGTRATPADDPLPSAPTTANSATSDSSAWTFESGSSVTLFPAGDVYPVYVADPQRPTNALLFSYYTHRGIPGTNARRTRLSAGGRFGMIRFDGGGQRGRSLQVSLDAGLTGLFDSNSSDDAIGWDGHYGLSVTTGSKGPWSFKFGLLHTSAHLGDEYSERMNRERINYTREEAAIGVGWQPDRRWRVYGEAAHSYYRGVSGEQPWRVEQGVEYEGPPRPLGGRFAWYWAVDLNAMQERSWRIDRALQGGLVAHTGRHAYRLAFEYYNGRPMISEFYTATETSISIGLRIDL